MSTPFALLFADTDGVFVKVRRLGCISRVGASAAGGCLALAGWLAGKMS